MSRGSIQLEELMREKAAEFLVREAVSFPLITITRAMSDDKRRSVKIFFTTIPEEKEDGALAFVNRKKSEFVAFLKENTRLRAIPHISFEIDYGERNRQNVDSLLSNS